MMPSRRTFAATLTVAALAGGLLVTTAPVASAASKVTFCFDWANGQDYAHKPVFLTREIDGKAVRVRRTVTDGKGCGSFTTPTDRVFWVKAKYVKSSARAVFWYGGRTPEKSLRGDGIVHLGTGKVRVVRAISAAGPLAAPPR